MYRSKEDRGRSSSSRDRWEDRRSNTSKSREGNSGVGWRERSHDPMNNELPRRDLLAKPWRKSIEETAGSQDDSSPTIMSVEAREAIEREIQERLKGTSITSLWADDEGDDTLPLPGDASSDSTLERRDETSTINDIKLPSAVSNTNFPNWRNSGSDSHNSYSQQQQQNRRQERLSRLTLEYDVGAKTAVELEGLITRHITVRMKPDASAETVRIKFPKRS